MNASATVFFEPTGPTPRLRGALRRTVVALAVTLALTAAGLVGVVPSASAAEPCGPGSNAIACENSKPGTPPEVWDISGAGDPSIQGFATDISVNIGSRIDFKIDTDAANYSIRIFRTGWYQGNGARLIDTVQPSATLPQNQPECISDLTTELYDCGTWRVSASWNVPATAVSGVYVALLRRADTGGDSHIIFIVRDDASTSDILFQTSDPTWHAYNTYGGSDFYQGGDNGRAYKVSYNRPFATRESVTRRDFYFSSEYAQVRFLERNGYDVSYASGIDTDRFGSHLLNHDVFLSVGHDEYWSGAQRANIEAARDAGVNLQFLTGNEGYWRTRYEPAASSDATAYRTLVTYKETWSNTKIDPAAEWTGTWRDPRYAPQSAGAGLPENALTGTMYMVNNDDLPVTVSAEEGKLRLWRDTSLATLPAGSSAELAPHTVGYESNEDIDNGFRPDGLVHLSTTTGPTPEYLLDYGNTVRSGSTTHHLTLYRAPSGALVFSAGSVQWAWGLDEEHDGDGAPADIRMQQAQVNLLADMRALPATLMAGLVMPVGTTDVTAPTVTVVTPSAGASIASGTTVTATGTAADVGGRVAGVEVSTDNGESWHLADGTSTWSYSYTQTGAGAVALLVRAIDDSANYPATPASVSLTVTGPFSVFGDQQPSTPDSQDTSPVELGLQFTPEVDGFVAGVRFYKSEQNRGPHVGTLWDAAGNAVASVNFETTTSGWQSAYFTHSVPVAAGQTYTVSYGAPAGHYAVEARYWPYDARSSAPIAVAAGFEQQTAGVFGSLGNFPAERWDGSNYFVDVVFDTLDRTPLAAAEQTPAPGATFVASTTSVSAKLTSAIDEQTLAIALLDDTGLNVAGTTTYDATTRVVTFIPTAPLAAETTYFVQLAATSLAGDSLTTGAAWSFTTAIADGTTTSLFTPTDVPAILQVGDNASVELGVQFSTQATGVIAGMRFYKAAGNVGTHVGTLWTSSGQQLATATFVGESRTGWQTVYFGEPVSVQAGASYVASYRAPAGAYSATVGAFVGDGISSGPLSVEAGGGRYTYQSGFPSATSSTNYFVDVIFVGDPTAPVPSTATSVTPPAGAVDVALSTQVNAVLSPIPSDAPEITVSDTTGPIAGTVAWQPDTGSLTFTPTDPLAASTVYQVRVSIGGVTVGKGEWPFYTTTYVPAEGDFSLFASETPAVTATAEDSAVELGTAFTVTTPGAVTGIRFYKGAANTGAHVGSLWTADGAKLAEVTFAAETASGWQTAFLASPVMLTAGQRYVVSYHAPNGHYSYTSNYFATPRTSGPLVADTVQNGRFAYGAAGRFPENSWNASNYFVDVVFSTTYAPPAAVTSTTPAANATQVAPTAAITATLDRDIPTGTPTLALTAAAGPTGAVAGASSYDPATRTVTFTPTAPLEWNRDYTARATLNGQALESGEWRFTTAEAPPAAGTYSLLSGVLPQTAATSDGSSVELGMAFATTQPGSVTAIRFYKGSGNSGSHVGTLWKADGTQLARVVFTGETSAGWQTATLETAVPLTPGEQYVVSYLAPRGHYALTADYFSSPRSAGPLQAATSGNGRYLYGPGGFPTDSWNASNYFVDVVFASDNPEVPPTDPPTDPAGQLTVSSLTPPDAASDVAPTVTVSAQLTGTSTEPPTLQVSDAAGAIAGTSSWDAATGTLTFTPDTPFAWSTTLHASVQLGGTPLAGGAWSFSTAAAPPVVTVSSLFASDAIPQYPAWDDPDAVQFGTKFSSSVAGVVTGIRFYKGEANTGVHTGSLWSSGGVRLAEVAFIDETASGWQLAILSTPVRLQPGIEYRVTVHSSTGRYAVDLNGLLNPISNGPLSTPANAGVYVYGRDYPNNTSAHNFWVDVTFASD
ncbi:MAG: DUF4082 domain-containing protein [Microbacteriaceae bacterium]